MSPAANGRARPRAVGSAGPSLSPVARKIVQRDRRALARVISEVESGQPEALAVLRELYPRTGKATVVGISGPLGVGKSSLISRLLQHLRAKGLRVGILAVDPSSPFSGGAVLGDRIRVERTQGDEGVFFRSMASRGHAGGLAQSARDTVRLLDAFGMDVVLVETVGAGQVDVEVHDIASTRIVVVVPHLGDEVQTLKAGLFEIADVFVVNKSDLPGADRAAKDLVELAHLSVPREGWVPRVVQTSTIAPSGIEELWTAVEAHEVAVGAESVRARRRVERAEQELRELLEERVQSLVRARLSSDPAWSHAIDEVASGRADPYSTADRLVSELRRRL
jgi:LAO/AO transport system kinase